MQLCKTSTNRTAASLKLQALRKTWSQKAKVSSNVFGHKEAVFKCPARKQQGGKRMVNFGPHWWLSSKQPACHCRRLERPRLSPSLPREHPTCPGRLNPAPHALSPCSGARGLEPAQRLGETPQLRSWRGPPTLHGQDPARPNTRTNKRASI